MDSSAKEQPSLMQIHTTLPAGRKCTEQLKWVSTLQALFQTPEGIILSPSRTME